MGKFVLLNATSYVGGYDFTTDTSRAELAMEAEAVEATVFGGNGWKELLGGLRSTTFELEGLWESNTLGVQGAVDPEAFSAFGAGDRLHTLAATGTETQPCYGWLASRLGYNLGGALGEIAGFTLKSQGSGAYGVVRGQLAKAKGNVSAIGAIGSVLNLGAPTGTQRVYAGLHVFGTPGTTITAQVQSDDSAGFASPTTRGTIGPVTANGGVFMTPVAGPFPAETHWRLNVSAITGTFTVAGWIAVQ